MKKNKIKGSKILVTGGAGFIGSHLVEHLLRKGADVIVVDDFSNGDIDNLSQVKNKIKIIKQDISEPFPKIKKIFKRYNFDGIFHLACFPRSQSLEKPFRDIEVNAIATLNILEIAKLNKAKVVFTSNSGIYGNPKYLPIDENHPNNPSTPYDANKLVSEYYMKIYYQIFNIPIAICRLAAVYGEKQKVKPGWKPLIPEFVGKISKNRSPIINWDGEQSRDFIYVKDVVQGLTKAFSCNSEDEVFILGTEIETSVNNLFEIICKHYKKEIKPKRTEKTPGDLRRMKLSYKKANKWFGFKPEYSISKGIENYINWLKS